MKTRLWPYSMVIAAVAVATGAFADVSLSATGGGGKISLSWTTTDSLRSVQVMRDTDADPAGRQRIATLSGSARSYTDSTAVNGQQYWYWLKYTDTAGTVGNSNAGSAKAADSAQPVAVTGVTVSPANASVTVGVTTTLGGTVLPANASNMALTWRSSNTSVATVSATGVVTGVAAGTATITASSADGNRSASSAVTVSAADNSNTGSCSTAAALPLVIDGAGEFCRVITGTISEFNSWNMQLIEINGVAFTNAYWDTWSSTKLPARINGSYTIRYIGQFPWSHLGVKGSGGSQPDSIAVTGVSVTPASVTVKAGASTSLSATVAPANASNKGVTWSSSNTGIATVSANGVVTGVAAGNATISVSTVDGKRSATSTVTVAAQANSTISAASASFDKNSAKQADLVVTMTLNGNTLSAIRNGSATLVAGTDYSVSGSTVTLRKSYLAKQPVGTLSLTFDFSAGTDPVLNLSVTDTSSVGTVPAAPTGVTATVIDNGAVNLAWVDQSNNEQGFRIDRRLAGTTAWATLVDNAANVKTYRDATVAMGNAYEYRVYAFNTAGSSAASSATATLLTLKAYGAQQYSAQGCSACHGADGKGQQPLPKYTEVQLATLVDKIATTMPSKGEKCKDNCAQGTARYLVDIMASGSDPLPQACSDSPPPSPRSLRLLTRQEYQNTVNDLLGLSVTLVNSLPEENRVDGFDNYVAENVVTGLRIEGFHTQALSLAAQGVSKSWSKIVPCSTQDTACATKFIQTFGKKAYRRPLTTAEQADYLALFSGNTFSAAVENAVGRMLASPNFLYRSELGVRQANGTYLLTPYETASALSYLFLGSLPDDALFSAADQNQLATSQQLEAQATRLLGLARAREQLGNFVGQWLLSASPYALPNKDNAAYPRFTADVKYSMSNELINFFNHVALDSTQKFKELFSANYIVANKTLADFYGVGGAAGTNYAKLPVADGTRNGIMTLGAVLSRYANSNESHPFKRGGFVYKRLLCDDLPPPANVGIVKAPKQDPNATTRQRFDFHSKSDASCWSCHQYMDAAGFAFEHYDGAGQYRATENGQTIDTAGNVLGIETFLPSEQVTVADLNGLSQIFANSPNAAQCVARQYYRYTTGKRESAADSCSLGNYLQSYSASGYDLKNMLTGIVTSPGFTLRRSN